MKRYLLFLSVTVLVSTSKTIAQDFRRADSSMTVWLNGLAKHSLYPCDVIKTMESDSAKKAMASRIEHCRALFAGRTIPADTFPLDSATLHFIREERIAMELLR